MIEMDYITVNKDQVSDIDISRSLGSDYCVPQL